MLTMYIVKMITNIRTNTYRIFRKVKLFFGYYNTHYYQKQWTKVALEQFKLGQSYSWGKAIEDEDELGDYLKIKDQFLLPNIKDKSVLEIGCLDGKWSQYIVPVASHSTLVDVSKEILPVLNVRLEKVGGGSTLFMKLKVVN